MNDVIYSDGLGKRLGKTAAAIRAAHQRRAEWLPPSFRMGRRLAWRTVDVDAFLKARAKKGGA